MGYLYFYGVTLFMSFLVFTPSTYTFSVVHFAGVFPQEVSADRTMGLAMEGGFIQGLRPLTPLQCTFLETKDTIL